MILMIAGSREGIILEHYQEIKRVLNTYFASATMIVHGGAYGADDLAQKYADEYKIKTIVIRPKYDKYGQAAPVIRNEQLAGMCDMGLIIWNGKKTKGTLNARKQLYRKYKMYYEYDLATSKGEWTYPIKQLI